MTLEIVIPNWFFEPFKMKISNSAAKFKSVGEEPSAIGVRHQINFRSDGFSNGLYAVQIFMYVACSHFYLDAAIPGVEQALGIRNKLIDAPVQPSSVRVIGTDLLLAGAAEQFPERNLSCFCLQIPKRYVNRTQGKMGNSSPPHPLQRRMV